MYLYIPQWQGSGPKNDIYKGAELIKHSILAKYNFVAPDGLTLNASDRVSDIQNRTALLNNLISVNNIIRKNEPQKIFTVGGDCSVEIAPISYLYKNFNKELTVLWLDAHADLNTPVSSPSKTFHGMPLRVLLGQGDSEILNQVSTFITTNDVVFLGLRDADPPEKQFIQENNIPIFTTREFNYDVNVAVKKILQITSQNIYIHLDLDVIDPKEFTSVSVPAEKGLNKQALVLLLKKLFESKNVVGASIVEFTGADPKDLAFVKDLVSIYTQFIYGKI